MCAAGKSASFTERAVLVCAILVVHTHGSECDLYQVLVYRNQQQWSKIGNDRSMQQVVRPSCYTFCTVTAFSLAC